MNYYAVLMPVHDPAKSASLLPEHLQYIATMVADSRIFAKGRFADGSGSLVIYKANSLEEAQKLASNDPYIIHRARGLEIHEWLINPKPAE
jgi:hypothetical protein